MLDLPAVLTTELTAAIKHVLPPKRGTNSGLWSVGLFQESVSEEGSPSPALLVNLICDKVAMD